MQLRDRDKRIRHILVRLDFADDFSGAGALGEVDEIGLCYEARDAVFDEG